MAPYWQGDWTRWSSEVPSNPSDSVIPKVCVYTHVCICVNSSFLRLNYNHTIIYWQNQLLKPHWNSWKGPCQSPRSTTCQKVRVPPTLEQVTCGSSYQSLKKISKNVYPITSLGDLCQCCTILPGIFFPHVQAESPKTQFTVPAIWIQKSHLIVPVLSCQTFSRPPPLSSWLSWTGEHNPGHGISSTDFTNTWKVCSLQHLKSSHTWCLKLSKSISKQIVWNHVQADGNQYNRVIYIRESLSKNGDGLRANLSVQWASVPFTLFPRSL